MFSEDEILYNGTDESAQDDLGADCSEDNSIYKVEDDSVALTVDDVLSGDSLFMP